MADPLIAILSLLLLTIGGGWIYPPLALVVPGALLLGGLIWKRMRSIPKAERTEET